MGGRTLASAGAEVVVDSAPIRVMGFGEVISHLRPILRTRRAVWRHVARAEVDLVVPVDFPGFNLRLAGHAHRLGKPVFYVVPPQLWAWGAWRVKSLRRDVDRLGTILPFEPAWFADRGVETVHLGHPLVEDYAGFPVAEARAERETRLQDPDRPVTIGLLPGSRRQEIESLLPGFKVAARMVQSWLGRRRVRMQISRAPGTDPRRLADLAGDHLEVVDAPLPEFLRHLDAAFVCSGTASLEVALAGVPHVVVYRTSALNHAIGRRVVKVSHIGLANLILDRSLVPEHIQADADPTHLANSLLTLLNTPGRREEFYQGCDDLRLRCGEPGVWERAADAILPLLEGRGKR